MSSKYGPWPPETLERAKELLDDGTGYFEAARSTGVTVGTLRYRFPGKGLTMHEAAKLGYAGMRFNRKAFG